ncbi:tetratricopeptide repeat protein [Streptomyces sp. HNM0574]|uniref:tetratricopeptide repeat protein n=1 Tax=Streptomyces sp. HNM0574 TaxID=2714954 RepID=UPI00146C1109|nr:tetratricopeptide repeat protein [Streptomyces sp. HNM0574]NLU66484.1 tetratricopeptide repeat protein [Streptomyces sp. HNM0574]
MASSPSASQGPRRGPNTAFRRLRGALSPGEFAAAVRRSAREIGEQVSCDARYIGRVEAGEIRCPNYAYERVFLHMFPGSSLADMGFAPRETVRGRAARDRRAHGGEQAPPQAPLRRAEPLSADAHHSFTDCPEMHEESDVLRRAFMTGGPAALAAASIGAPLLDAVRARPAAAAERTAVAAHRAGEAEASAVEGAVRRIRLLDDRHGADGLFRRAGDSLRAAYELLESTAHRRSVSDRLHNGAGELAISVGWLAHDSGRFDDARSHYAEALATARVASDAALEAHAFCNTAFLARDADRPREAVRAAQAGQSAAAQLGSARLLSLLSLREAGGWAGLGDRTGCQEALARAHHHFERGPADGDPEWMSFFGEAEQAGLEAQCWSALGDWGRAVEHARRAVALQDPHFVRNKALFTAELSGDLAAQRRPEEAAEAGTRALALLGPVTSSRIRGMLGTTARRLRPYRAEPSVAAFLERAKTA